LIKLLCGKWPLVHMPTATPGVERWRQEVAEKIISAHNFSFVRKFLHNTGFAAPDCVLLKEIFRQAGI